MSDHSSTPQDSKEDEINRVSSEGLTTHGKNSLQGFSFDSEKSFNDYATMNNPVDTTNSTKNEIDIPAGGNELTPEQKTITIPENGENVDVTGGLEKYKVLNHQQGEITGLDGSCGLCSVECIANMYDLKNDQGEKLSEKDVYEIAISATPPLCDVQTGATSPEQLKMLLEKMGLPAHISNDTNLENLASEVENGKAVKIGVESSEFWHQNPHDEINLLIKPDHAVTVIDTARDPKDNSLKGFFINDSNINDSYNGSGRFVSLDEMFWCWQNASGNKLVVDKMLPMNKGY